MAPTDDTTTSRDLLVMRPEGLYCPDGDFFVDPQRPVQRAVITHGHSDHARPGSRAYLCATRGVDIVRARARGTVEGMAFGEQRRIGSATVSFHPASHILGSAQVRVESRGQVWVVTGDYKTDPDPTCAAFEPVRCDTLITECTFGLPIYRWPDQASVFKEINTWWQSARESNRTAVLYAYSLGKAQRLLAGVDSSIGPLRTHDAVEEMNGHYRRAGITLAETEPISSGRPVEPGSLVLTPPGGATSQFGEFTTGFASGWMLIRNRRGQRGVDRGFVLSDHIDWPSLMDTVRESGASRVLPTHGNTKEVARYLAEQGLDASPLPGRSWAKSTRSEAPGL